MNDVLLKIQIILLLLKTSECTKVEDAQSQHGIHVSDYCPKAEGCPEGTHVMCMFQNNKMGSQCIDSKNVSVTRGIAVKILDTVNAMRSNIALGKEKGKNGQPLPRGYGIFRLKWDSELATFAQVLANQCQMRHDMCRSTKRFRSPSQIVGMARYTCPVWGPVKDGDLQKPGFSMEKILDGITRALHNWYNDKRHVLPTMVDNMPDWNLTPLNKKGWHYLKMIHGSATHVGCGFSAYSEFNYKPDQINRVMFNLVLMVCNFSASAKKGQTTYNKHPPTEIGYTVKCGCPEGYEEDEDCLCYETPVIDPVGRTCDGINCEPAVVLLPIFTVEDAPQHKVGETARRAESGSDSDYLQFSDLTGNTSSFKDTNDIFKSFELKQTEPRSDIFIDSKTPSTLSLRKNAPPKSNDKIMPCPYNSINQQVRTNYRIKQDADAPKSKRRIMERKDRVPPVDVKHRYFGKPPRIQALQRGLDHVQRKIKTHVRPSIFSRVHKFELPRTSRRNGTKLFTVRVTDFKRDVAPRKDFSYSQKLLNTYLDKKRHHENYSSRTFRIVNYYETSTLTAFVTLPTSNRHHNFSNPNLKRYMISKFRYPEFNTSNYSLTKRVNIKSSNEESDKKLMALLDNLEKEVNHIDLNMNEKEIFDAKIRKIYGSVNGRDSDLLSPKNDDTHSSAPLKVLEDLNKKVNDDRFYETEDKVKELHLKLRPGFYSRPVVDNLNSIEYDERNREQKQCKSDANSCTVGLTDHEELNRPYFEEKSYKSGDKNYNEQIMLNDEVRLDDLVINDMKIRNVYKTELDNKKLKDDRFIGERRNNIRYKNNGPRHLRYRNGYRRKNDFKEKEGPRDPLGVNRRKQYQQKLDKLERRMHDVRSFRRRNEHERERAMRLMRPSSRNEVPIRPSVMKNPVGPIYMPDRARFLHGF